MEQIYRIGMIRDELLLVRIDRSERKKERKPQKKKLINFVSFLFVRSLAVDRNNLTINNV